MVVFTEKVFDGVVRDTAELFSDSKFDELLGSCDDAPVEVEVEEVVSGSATLTVRWYHSNSGKGFVGLYSGSLVTFPVDADGRETCRDALVYPAESFFVDGAGEMARGIAEGYADLYESGAATVAAANASRRRSKVAA